MTAKETVKNANRIRRQLAAHIPEKLCDAGLVVDLADIHEISIWACQTIERIATKELTKSELESAFIEMEVQLLFHMQYHLKSLTKQLPKVLKALE